MKITTLTLFSHPSNGIANFPTLAVTNTTPSGYISAASAGTTSSQFGIEGSYDGELWLPISTTVRVNFLPALFPVMPYMRYKTSGSPTFPAQGITFYIAHANYVP